MASSLVDEKHELRRRCSARRRALARTAAPGAARTVVDALLGCPAVRSAGCIALYAALPDEFPTRPIFEGLAAPGRRLALPRAGAGRGLSFAAVDEWEVLRPERWGVQTPPDRLPSLAPEEIDVVLVPGVAFDAAGHRLGRGGGFYDATFPVGSTRPLLIGLAWFFQLVDAVPHGSRDRRVDAIVTERGCVAKRGKRK